MSREWQFCPHWISEVCRHASMVWAEGAGRPLRVTRRDAENLMLMTAARAECRNTRS